MSEAPYIVEEVAALLRMSKSWVYANKLMLGGYKMCPGRKGWKFKMEVVEAYKRSREGMVEDDEEESAGPYRGIEFNVRRTGGEA